MAFSVPVERPVNKWGGGGYGKVLGADVMQVHFLDEPPQSAALTTYDREHMKLYMRLLDAATDGADWREAVTILFGLDPDRFREGASRRFLERVARELGLAP